jgi:hypothetical protein
MNATALQAGAELVQDLVVRLVARQAELPLKLDRALPRCLRRAEVGCREP